MFRNKNLNSSTNQSNLPYRLLLVLAIGTAVTITTASCSMTTPEMELSKAETWLDQLPNHVASSVLWCADHEVGSLFDWEYDGNSKNNGGGVFNTGGPRDAIASVDSKVSFTGEFCAKATICGATNQSRAVRLMRWTDKPWDRGGKFFPEKAYYGIWMRIDENYKTRDTDEAWWNVFQFKSKDDEGQSRPVWTLNIGNQRDSNRMHFYLYSPHNRASSVAQNQPVPIPVGRWFHVEAFYQQSQSNLSNGCIRIWQDGKLILNAESVSTILSGELVWGVGNYTDFVSGGDIPGSATIYFDDATVSTLPVHEHVETVKNSVR